MIILETEIQKLSCPLTNEELITAGNELSKTINKIKEEKETQKAAKSAMKAVIDELSKVMAVQAEIVRNKAEVRPIDVKHMLNDSGMVEYVRSDTGEIIETRKAKPGELQNKMDIPPTEK